MGGVPINTTGKTLCVFGTGSSLCHGDIRLHAVRSPGENGWVSYLCEKHVGHLKEVGVATVQRVETHNQGKRLLKEWNFRIIYGDRKW